MRKPYPSDLTDEQWAIIEPLIPSTRPEGPARSTCGRCSTPIFYLNRSGCQWDMIPHDLPAKSTVHDHFKQWKADGTWQTILDSSASAGPHRRRS